MGYPFLFGFSVYSNFDRKSTFLPVPDRMTRLWLRAARSSQSDTMTISSASRIPLASQVRSSARYLMFAI
ncbi:hypothetical protein MPLA_750038 [Mesorhizobium sp. ORS 3359]|nr:hypothetical protein MPLA_750038 [Mesorhizobium sp. ORS 3359]